MSSTRRRTLAATTLAAALAGGAVVSGVASPDGSSRQATRLAASSVEQPRVLLVSVDGLNPHALRKLGEAGLPELHRLIDEGASTLNARALVEQTETLPNHIGMVTGRPIDRLVRGHGVTWNDDRRRPRTVHRAAQHQVASIFSLAERNALAAALFSGKEKFRLMSRSWAEGIDRTVIDENNRRLARKARRDLRAGGHDLTMVHLSLPDVRGHRHGFMSEQYLDGVRIVDRLVGLLMDVVQDDRTWVVLTADHGGVRGAHRHEDATRPAAYRVPFIVWGPDVAAGADLYGLNPALADPGKRRPGYRGRQPVRNADAANVVARLFGLPPVPGSTINARSELNWDQPSDFG
jgi:predicted AlkP superfamily pyrophosphatase or phosphodiesterase